MKVALDTSVIVAAVFEEHPHHLRASWWLRTRRNLDRIASWHAYAEAWAVLSALPIEPRVSGEVAAAVLDRLLRRLAFVAARSTTYPSAVARCNARGLRSRAVYDALHLVTAEVESASLFLTFNVEDFTRLAEPDGPRIVATPRPARNARDARTTVTAAGRRIARRASARIGRPCRPRGSSSRRATSGRRPR